MGSKLNKALEFIGVTRNTSDDDYEDDFYDDEEEAPKQEEKAVGRASNNNRYAAKELRAEREPARYSGSSRYAASNAAVSVQQERESAVPSEDTYEMRRRKTKLSSIPGGAGKTMIIHSPSSYSESQKLVLQLKQNKQVIVKLDTLETEVAQRILDFMSGASFALEFQVAKISKGIYLFASNDTRIEKPEPVQLDQEEAQEEEEAFYTLDDSADTRRR